MILNKFIKEMTAREVCVIKYKPQIQGEAEIVTHRAFKVNCEYDVDGAPIGVEIKIPKSAKYYIVTDIYWTVGGSYNPATKVQNTEIVTGGVTINKDVSARGWTDYSYLLVEALV